MNFKIPLLRIHGNYFFRLWILTMLIPGDSHWERDLSLALDRALAEVELC